MQFEQFESENGKNVINIIIEKNKTRLLKHHQKQKKILMMIY